MKTFLFFLAIQEVIHTFTCFTDDIFADTSSSASKPKKTKKTQKSSKAPTTAAFEKDAPNIFDDPLSALDS